MAHEQWQGFCNFCQKHSLHTKVTNEPNHVVHLLISLFLCGCWLPVWILIAISAASERSRIPFRCSVCGQAYGELTPQQIATQQQLAAQVSALRRQRIAQQTQQLGAQLNVATNAATARLAAFWHWLVPAVVNFPKNADRALGTLAGDGNEIVHWFLRVLSVSALVAFLCGAIIAALR